MMTPECDEMWKIDGEENGWRLPDDVPRWKRLPVIRHIRFIYYSVQIERHNRFWSSLGKMPSGYDEWYLHAIYTGRA